MHLTRDGRLERTDLWREGQWLDLWSVVHLLTGASLGFAARFSPLSHEATVLLALAALIAYELWEYVVDIDEAPTNRVMDVVVGMVSFTPVYLYLAPALPLVSYILVFGLVLTADAVMSTFGWIASQKAAALEARMRARLAKRRARIEARRALREQMHAR